MNCYNFGGDQLTLCEASDQQYLELKGGGGNQLILFEASDNNIWSWGWRNMQKYRPGWCALMKTGHCKLLGEPSHAHTRQMLTRRVKWLQQLNLHSRAFLLSMEMDMQIQIWTCETHIYILVCDVACIHACGTGMMVGDHAEAACWCRQAAPIDLMLSADWARTAALSLYQGGSSLDGKGVFQFSAAGWDGVALIVIFDVSVYCSFSFEGLKALPMWRKQTSLHGLCCVRKLSVQVVRLAPAPQPPWSSPLSLLKGREQHFGEEGPHAARCGGFVVTRAEVASTRCVQCRDWFYGFDLGKGSHIW